MKALTIRVNEKTWDSTYGYTAEEVPEPLLDEQKQPEDAYCAIVKVISAGVCGTDKSIWNRKALKKSILYSLNKANREYWIAGHELLGNIIQLGSKVSTTFSIGQSVAAESHLYCGVCYACQNNNRHICVQQKTIGVTTDGCFAEKIKIPANVLWPTDIQKIRPEIASIQEPFGNAMHACTPLMEENLAGQDIVISGCGTIGLFSTLITRAMAARRILCIDPCSTAREKAKLCGADLTMAPSATPEETKEKILKYFNNKGANFALEMSGAKDSYKSLLYSTCNGGRIVLFGLNKFDLQIPELEKFILQGKSIHSIVGRRVFHTWEKTRKILENTSNSIQDKIWKIILEEGKDTIVDFNTFNAKIFEEKMNKHSKIILRM